MPREKISFSVALSPGEMDHLKELATKFECHAITGATAGEPSVRRLIAEIAANKFVLSSRLSHGRRNPPASPTPRRRSSTGEVIEPGQPAATPAPVDGQPPERPIWWDNDECGTATISYSLAELPDARIAEARAAGIEERDGEFWADDSWFPADEPPAKGESFFAVKPARPGWWPANGATRGDLVDLLVTHGECGSAAGVDDWIRTQGEWERKGTVFVRAIDWNAATQP